MAKCACGAPDWLGRDATNSRGHCRPNLVRAAPPLRSNMFFGKDRLVIFMSRPYRHGHGDGSLCMTKADLARRQAIADRISYLFRNDRSVGYHAPLLSLEP